MVVGSGGPRTTLSAETLNLDVPRDGETLPEGLLLVAEALLSPVSGQPAPPTEAWLQNPVSEPVRSSKARATSDGLSSRVQA